MGASEFLIRQGARLGLLENWQRTTKKLVVAKRARRGTVAGARGRSVEPRRETSQPRPERGKPVALPKIYYHKLTLKQCLHMRGELALLERVNITPPFCVRSCERSRFGQRGW